MRRLAGLAAAGAIVLSACTPAVRPTDELVGPGVDLGSGRLELAAGLQSFAECGEVLDYFQESAAEMGVFAFGGVGGLGDAAVASGRTATGRGAVAESAAPAADGAGDALNDSTAAPAPEEGVDYSGTNVQEAGVDEPDLVKTDGELIVAVAQNQLHVVDARGDTPVLRASLSLGDTNFYGGELFLTDGRVLLLSNGWRNEEAAPSPSGGTRPGSAEVAADIAYRPGQPVAVLTSIDISDPDEPRVANRIELDGEYVTARLVDGIARIVLRSAPHFEIQPLPGAGSEAEVQRQVATAVEGTELTDWLPSVRADGGEEEPLVSCDAVSRPPEPSGVGTVTVLTVDADRELAIAHTASVVADAATVYASRESLYIATNGWSDPRILQRQAEEGAELPFFTTELHKFDISDPSTSAYVASGRVRGHLLNQWSLSEHEGHLRAATTEFPEWIAGLREPSQPQSQSFLTVMGQDGNALVTTGQVGGLGVDERIYAVRYFGDTGYVVTFRQTDPLYVLDLSDPTAPAVRGELKILGYSSYLHPVGEGLLLGVGQDATEEGRILGTQLSLFDVSDPTDPQRIHQAQLGAGNSSVEFDHRAFLWWPEDRLTVVPLEIYGAFDEPAVERDLVDPVTPEDGGDAVAPGSAPPPQEYFGGAVGFTVDRDAGIAERGRLTHMDRNPAFGHGGPVMRSLVIGDSLYTVSEAGLLASDLGTFADRGWVSF